MPNYYLTPWWTRIGGYFCSVLWLLCKGSVCIVPVKTLVKFLEWHSYLSGVTTAQTPHTVLVELELGCGDTCQIWTRYFNSMAPGRFKVNFRWVIFKLILVVNGRGISCETALIWVSLDHTYDKSTLVQVMAWCHQATSHYLSQCWARSLSPCGVSRPQ